MFQKTCWPDPCRLDIVVWIRCLAHGLWFFGVALATFVITRSLGFNLEFVCVSRTPRLPVVHTTYNRWIRDTVREIHGNPIISGKPRSVKYYHFRIGNDFCARIGGFYSTLSWHLGHGATRHRSVCTAFRDMVPGRWQTNLEVKNKCSSQGDAL